MGTEVPKTQDSSGDSDSNSDSDVSSYTNIHLQMENLYNYTKI